MAFGNDPDMSARVVEVCRKVTDKPLITKLSPNQTDIAYNASRCIDAGTDALAVINTLMGMAIDIESRSPVIGNNQGDCPALPSSPWPCSRCIRYIRWPGAQHSHYRPGGVTTAEDALEFLIAGASAVGVGTTLFYDPLICTRINAGILDYLERKNWLKWGRLPAVCV